MQVRDELYGSEYAVTAVRWVKESSLSREATATHSDVLYWGEDEQTTPEHKAWALGADGDEFFPVVVL